MVWLEDMIDVSMKHAPATTCMLLERKLKHAEKEREHYEKERDASLG